MGLERDEGSCVEGRAGSAGLGALQPYGRPPEAGQGASGLELKATTV